MRLRKRQQHEIVGGGGSTNAAAELIGAVAPSAGHGLAYVDSLGVIERVRFTDVARRAAEWAELVREHGVQPGDRVIVLAGRDREWRFALLGVIMAGGVAVPCPASTPARELRAIASEANAVLFVSARARLDLAAPDGPRALSSDDLERRHKAMAAQHVPHLAMPADVALIVSDHGPDGLRGAVHTHASLAEGADVAERWLALRAGDRLWASVANGSIESIWLLLGAWRVGAEIVDVDHPFDLETELEVLARFQPATVWFSDDEYAALAVVRASEWIEPGSIRCAVTSPEAAEGATAFAHSFGATVLTVDVSPEAGVRPVGDVPPAVEQGPAAVFEGADPKLLAALEAAAAATVAPDAPVAAPSSREDGKLRKEAERAAVEERRRVEAAGRAEREASAAEERKRAEEEKRRDDERGREEAKRHKEADRVAAEERKVAAAAERRRADEEKRVAAERKRETAKIRKLAEREAAKERSRVEEEERARRHAAAGAERKRAEEEKRREAERAREEAEAKKEAEREAEKAKRAQREAEAAAERERAEEEKRREPARAQEDAKARKEAERQAEKDRRRAEEAQREERKAAAAAERKRAEEEKRREAERAREEGRARKEAERAAEKERRRAEEQERAERAAAAAAERKRLEDEKRREAEREREEAKSRKVAERAAAKERRRIEGERARKRQRDAAERAERERLAPDRLSSITDYGIGASSVESGRREGETTTAPSAAPSPDTRRDA